MARVAVIHRPVVARGQEAIDLIVAAHTARKREKAERHKMADGMVDLLLENRELRRTIRDIVAAASDGDRISGAIRFGNPHLCALLELAAGRV